MRHKREAEKYRTPFEDEIKKESINGALLNNNPGFSPAFSDLDDKRLLSLLQEKDNGESFKSLKQDAISSLLAEEQYEAVKNQYYGTDKCMIAPNGRASNLTERQWIQTRTPSFLNWGGDWINNPKSASVILDENGEPKRFYHGSISSFDTFREGENGIYFTDNKEAVWSYGAHSMLYEVFLKADETFEMDFEGEPDTEETESHYALETEARHAKENGYDSVIAYNTFDGENNLDQYIVFSPSQIKSATGNNGGFSLESDSILKQDDDYSNVADLTEEFSLIKSGEITADDVERYINGLIGQVFDTATRPLQIQITEENRAHVVRSNVNLKGNGKLKHNTALMDIERIINQANRTDRDGKVDYSHNTRKATLRHKEQVVEYVYFTTPIKINDNLFDVELVTERKEKQSNNLLDLYNVRVKKIDSAATQSVSQTGDNNRMSSDTQSVKSLTKSEEETILTILKQIAEERSAILRVPTESDFLFQYAYHGAGADFNEFSLDFIGSGEGSQVFGYGLYFTESDVIARKYAAIGYNSSRSYKESQIKSYKEQYEKAKAELEKAGKQRAKDEKRQDELKAEARKKIEDEYKRDVNSLSLSIKLGAEERRTKRLAELESSGTIYTIRDWELKILQRQYAAAKNGYLQSIALPVKDKHLYKVIIPDNGYLSWYDEVPESLIKRLAEYRASEGLLFWTLEEEIQRLSSAKTGGELYALLAGTEPGDHGSRFIDDFSASWMLSRIGVVGIKYPAGSILGLPDNVSPDTYNYVIFDPKDIEIADHQILKQEAIVDLEDDSDVSLSAIRNDLASVSNSSVTLKQIGDDEWTLTAKRIALEAGSLEDFFKLYRARIDSGDLELSDSNTALLLSDIYEESRSNEYADYDEYYDGDYEELSENGTDISDDWSIEEVEEDNPSLVSSSSMSEDAPDFFNIGETEEDSISFKTLSSDDADTAYVKRWLGTNFSEDSSENNFMATILKAAAKARGMDGQSFIEKYFTEIQQSQDDDSNTKGYMSTKRDEVTKEVKATIYAGKNADATTFLHELHHAIMLMGDNMKEFTQIYNKIKGTKQFRAFLEENIDLIKERIARKDSDGKFITDEKGRYSIDETKLNSFYQNSEKWTEDDFEFEARLYEAFNYNGFFKAKLNDEVVEYFDKLYCYDASTGKGSTLSGNGDMQFLDDAIEMDSNSTWDTSLKSEGQFSQGNTENAYADCSKAVDLTEGFSLIKNGEITADDVKNYIDGLIGQVFDTASEPLQIQITKDNKIHVVKSNVLLRGEKKIRHDSALANIENIINSAKVTDKDGTVDLSHNSKRKTLEHKSQVVKYVYFETPVRIGESNFITELATEQKKGQEENLLDLYNVKVKKIDPAATNLIASQTRADNRMASDTNLVNSPISAELEAGDATVLRQDAISSLSAEEQYETVKNQYYGTGKYMIAPNGRASNLTERQWIQVRTPNFKEWFGDWENDPLNASKVLDENGEPKQLYHGTFKNGYTVFEGKRGIYFTSDRTTAESYASGLNKGVYTVFLKADIPLTIDAEGSKWSSLRFEGSREYKKTLGTTILSPADIASYAKDSGTPYDSVIIRNIRDGNDDIVKNIADDYIVFSPSQIKSATDNNGDFSLESDSILKQDGKEEVNAGYRNAADLSEGFSLIKSGEITAEDVENYIKGLINQVFDTATNPMKIKITAGNKPHIVESNVVLAGNKRVRHDSALMDIERIINKAERTQRDGTVNADHNSQRTKNRKLKHIADYVYFETSVLINDEYFSVGLTTERRLNQDENLLNLYKVRVKKNNSAGTNTKIVVSQTGASDSMSSDTQSVKSLTTAEKEALHQTDAYRNYEDLQIKARSDINIEVAIAESVTAGDKNTRHLDKGNIRSIGAIKDDGRYYITNEGENSDAYRRSKTYASAPHVRSDQMATSLNHRLRQLLENRITSAIAGVGAERGKNIDESAVSEIVLKEIEDDGFTEVDVYICSVQTSRLSPSGLSKKINQPSVQRHQLPSDLPPSADLKRLRVCSASGIPEERGNVQIPVTSVLNSNIGGKCRDVKSTDIRNLFIFLREVYDGDAYGIVSCDMNGEGKSGRVRNHYKVEMREDLVIYSGCSRGFSLMSSKGVRAVWSM